MTLKIAKRRQTDQTQRAYRSTLELFADTCSAASPRSVGASLSRPGGRPAASFLHLARTVSRRAERLIVALASRPEEPVSEPAIRYVNRLSDLLFVAARRLNRHAGRGDVQWRHERKKT